MESNNKSLDEKKQAELRKMTLKIIERYELYNYSFAYKIAETAYNNGIHLDKFTKEYYKDPFNLDEIIYYLIQKELKSQKIVAFSPRDASQSIPTDSSAKIIPITTKHSSRHKR